jgi:hypothetical protein
MPDVAAVSAPTVTLVIPVYNEAAGIELNLKAIVIGGFTTVIVLLLFIGSIRMFSLGLLGLYIARIYGQLLMAFSRDGLGRAARRVWYVASR